MTDYLLSKSARFSNNLGRVANSVFRNLAIPVFIDLLKAETCASSKVFSDDIYIVFRLHNVYTVAFISAIYTNADSATQPNL